MDTSNEKIATKRPKNGFCGFCASLWLKNIFAFGLILLLITGGPAVSRPQQAASPTTAALDTALLNQYCITCHNQRAKTAGLMLDTLDYAHLDKDAPTWEKVIRKIKTGMMPPSGARRPDRGQLDAFANEVEKRLDSAAARNPNPGAPALHRLNRTEYANVIRDLLALDIDVTALLPPDDATDGFDNIADALGTSPALIQGYVSAAMKISRRAVGDRTLIPSQATYNAPGGFSQDRHIEGLPLGTRGGMLIQHTFPTDAEYEFSIGGGFGGGGIVDITIDGEKVDVRNTRSFRLPIQAGPHTIGAAVVDRTRGAGVDEQYSDFRVNSAFTVAGGVNSIIINGPFDMTGAGDTPSRRRIFVCQPASSSEDIPCARQILMTVGRRAFRRSVLDSEMTTLMNFYQQGRKDADFETGIQQALARMLVAPAFLYRVEDEPAGLTDGGIYRISNLELASRLSFFLWSSMPDDELVDLAAKGRLSDPKILEQQARRMLADPKSRALITNFAGQWLGLRELAKVETSAKNFDENLRQSFRRETELLFESIVREDRGIVDLLDADYTFVDERLAQHYAIPNIHGSYFRRVALNAASPRRGVLGQGSFLTISSVGTRTSPVTRGRWILENVLGTPAPVPPPGVDTDLEKDAEQVKVTSLRQRLELHRKVEPCASCHKIMDPIGFALENFDMVGTWREVDGKTPIDASGQLVDGTKLQSAVDLRNALLSRREMFVSTATQKLLTYAIGRTVQYYDMPTVRTIVRRSAANDYRFSSLVVGIVQSDPFQKKMKVKKNSE
jgi:mono/diheme cytochrome c family protein